MRPLERRLGEQDAVVRDDAHLGAVDAGEARHERGAVVALELGELAAVDDARDDLVRGDLPAEVGPHDAGELFGVVERFLDRLAVGVQGETGLGVVEIGDAPAREDDGVRVVDGQVVRDTGDGAVEVAAAQFLRGDNLACGGLHERRTSEEDGALVLDDDGLVAHRRHIGASGRTGAHDDRYLGYTHRTHPGLVVEYPTEVLLIREDIRLVRQVGSARVDEVDARELVLLRDRLRAEMLLDGDRVVCSSLDGAVVGDDHAGDALDGSDARDDPSGRYVLAGIHLVACQRGELQERCPGVDQGGYPIARQHLAPGEVFLLCLLRSTLCDGRVQAGHPLQELVHLSCILLELRGGGVNGRLQDGHGGGMMRMSVVGNCSGVRSRCSQR